MRRALISLLVAEAVSMTGSRISTVAVPWLVLTTTGSAVRVGTVAFAQMLPYVVAGLLSGPLADRFGARRTAVAADAGSAAAVAVVPALYAFDLLSFEALVVSAALAGVLGGCGDTAKRALLPRVIVAAGTPMTRGTALYDGIGRAATLLGLPLAGVLIAVLGPVTVLVIDAASFAVGAAMVAAGVRAGEVRAAVDRPHERYAAALGAGLAYLRKDRLIIAIVLLLVVTNMVDQAYTVVFVPVWVRDAGAAPALLGLLGGAFGLGAVAGNVVYTALATRLPRHATFAVCFLVGGSPRLFALALTDAVAPVLAVAFGAGVVMAAINPISFAVAYELIPVHLQGRVLGAAGALATAGVPLGGLLGGVAVQSLGLRPALLLGGVLYLMITLSPFALPVWRRLDAPADVRPGVD